MAKDTLRIISPNGHLGFAPTKEESFYIGAATKPDYYCCDSGSDDIGPCLWALTSAPATLHISTMTWN